MTEGCPLIHQLFLRQAALRPEAPAILTHDAAMTYGHTETLSGRWAAHLQALGVKPGEPVAVVLRKGWEQVVAVLAVLRAGGAYLPIDPEVPAERLHLLLAKSRVAVALTHSSLNEASGWPEGVRKLLMDGEAPAAGNLQEIDQSADSMAYLMYTSGSTGEPKGVMVGHRGIVNVVLETNRAFDVTNRDRAIAITALHHDLSVYDIFGMLAAGGAIVMPAPSEARDPAAWAQLIVTRGVTIWNSVPAFFQILLGYLEGERKTLPGTLRLVFNGGDWVPLTAPQRARGIFGGLRFLSIGGPTETTVWNVWYEVKEVDPSWPSIPYGKAIPNTRSYVLDEAGRECGPGEAGEMCCGGVGLTLGYWEDDELTSSKFTVHPVTGERLFRTGDRGCLLPDGNLRFLGRLDNQVKIHGYRIELGEVEAALARIPGVRRGIALVRQLEGGDGQLVAALQADPDLSESLATEHLRRTLPAQLIPESIRFVDQFPLNSNGKIDRKALLTLWQRPAAPEHPADLAGAMARLWAEVLGLPEVSPDANFFDLGGKSLQLMRIRAQLETQYGVSAPVTDFFRFPTVRALAAFLANGNGASPARAAAEDRARKQREALQARRPAPLRISR